MDFKQKFTAVALAATALSPFQSAIAQNTNTIPGSMDNCAFVKPEIQKAYTKAAIAINKSIEVGKVVAAPVEIDAPADMGNLKRGMLEVGNLYEKYAANHTPVIDTKNWSSVTTGKHYAEFTKCN